MSGKSLNSYWREIVAIVEGGLKPDPRRVSSFADRLAKRLEEEGTPRLARRIRQLVEGASKPAGSNFSVQGLAADVELQQSLVEPYVPVGEPNYPVLPRPVKLELQRFVELNRRSGELASAGIDPPSTLLMFGPPGCGKTMAAIAIACDLDLPLFVVRLDSLLGSFLGNSAKNLRRIFDNALARPCVLLMDEFDVMGKMRDDANEVGEVKRLVGSLLQNLDRVQGKQIIIGATNHHHMLDEAIWRRFDVTLHLQMPGVAEMARIIQRLIPEHRLPRIEVAAVAKLMDGLSGSDVTSLVHRAIQDEFLNPHEPLGKLITLGALVQVDGNHAVSTNVENKRDLILAIHRRSEGELTIRQVARLVGCSHTYAYDVIKAVGEEL